MRTDIEIIYCSTFNASRQEPRIQIKVIIFMKLQRNLNILKRYVDNSTKNIQEKMKNIIQKLKTSVYSEIKTTQWSVFRAVCSSYTCDTLKSTGNRHVSWCYTHNRNGRQFRIGRSHSELRRAIKNISDWRSNIRHN